MPNMDGAKTRHGARHVRDLIVREAFETLRTAFKYGTFAFLAYCGWRSISALSGRTTDADLKLAVTTAIQVGKQEWTPWLATVLVTAWALSERLFRLRKTDASSARIADLERRLVMARQSVSRERRSAGG
jgi:hypothetical protein